MKDFLGIIKPWLLRGIGFLLLFHLMLRTNLKQIFITWQGANTGLLLLAAVFIVPMIFIKVYRWRYILRKLGIDYSLLPALNAYLASYYFGIITPGRIGELLKAYYLCEINVSLGSALASVIIDRLMDLGVLVMVAVLGITFLPQFRSLSLVGWIGLVIGLLFLICMFLLINSTVFDVAGRYLLERVIPKERDDPVVQLTSFLSGLRILLKIPNLFALFLYTLASWMIIFAQSFAIAKALSIEIYFWHLSLAIAVAGIVASLPISIAGLGIRDTVIVEVLAMFGISRNASLAFSLLYFLIFGILLGVIGAAFWYRKPIKV